MFAIQAMDKITIPGVKEQLEIYKHIGPFDEGVAALSKEGLPLISARDLADARILGGIESPVSKDWTYAAESFNYFPNGDLLIASRNYNPLLKKGIPEEIVNRERRELGKSIPTQTDTTFYLDDIVANHLQERAESDPEKAVVSGVLRLSRKSVKQLIPTTSLNDEPVLYFLFQDMAKKYGAFLNEHRIKYIHLQIVDPTYPQKVNGKPKSPFLSFGDERFFSEKRMNASKYAFSKFLTIGHLNPKIYATLMSGAGTIRVENAKVYGMRRSPTASSSKTFS